MNAKSNLDIFVANLSVVTSGKSLVKLNTLDQGALSRRMKLLGSVNRDPESKSSAVYIYICNVLANRQYAANYSEQKRAVKAVADVLTTAWVLHDTGGYESTWLTEKLNEAFSHGLDRAVFPTQELISVITNDFDRISDAIKKSLFWGLIS